MLRELKLATDDVRHGHTHVFDWRASIQKQADWRRHRVLPRGPRASHTRMGLFVIKARFASEAPSESELRAALHAIVGLSDGLDSITQSGRELQICVDMEPVTRPYLLRILREKGATIVAFDTGLPIEVELPSYVHSPWRALPLWKRVRIRAGFLLRLFATALPRRQRGR